MCACVHRLVSGGGSGGEVSGGGGGGHVCMFPYASQWRWFGSGHYRFCFLFLIKSYSKITTT